MLTKSQKCTKRSLYASLSYFNFIFIIINYLILSYLILSYGLQTVITNCYYILLLRLNNIIYNIRKIKLYITIYYKLLLHCVIRINLDFLWRLNGG